MRKFARRQPDNLQSLLDKVEEFINEEEILKAMRAALNCAKKSKTRRGRTTRE
jgi:hypothetical protein